MVIKFILADSFMHEISNNYKYMYVLILFFIPPVNEVYRGYIVLAFSVCLCVNFFFPSKISQELLDLGS